MNEQRPGVQELYGVAVNARKLTMDAENRTLLDFIVASGMAGARLPLASSWLRWLYGDDAHEWRAVYDSVYAWAMRKAAVSRWTDVEPLRQVILIVLWWYKHGVCPACHGTKREIIPGTPMLSDVPCKTCHGEGVISLDRLLMRYGPDWTKRGKMIRAYLDEQSDRIARDIVKRVI